MDEERKVQAETDPSPAGQLLGRRWLGIDPASGEAELSFYARPEFANRYGTVQGGFLAAMLDSAVASTLIRALPAEAVAVTTRLDIRYLRPGRTGGVRARARIDAQDAKTATVSARLLSPSGEVLAEADATLRILKRPPA